MVEGFIVVCYWMLRLDGASTPYELFTPCWRIGPRRETMSTCSHMPSGTFYGTTADIVAVLVLGNDCKDTATARAACPLRVGVSLRGRHVSQFVSIERPRLVRNGRWSLLLSERFILPMPTHAAVVSALLASRVLSIWFE